MTEETRGRARVQQSAFVPLVLLLLILAIVGFLNTGIVEPYTGPRAVADAGGAFIFYDGADRGDPRLVERSFFLRRSQDGRRWDKAHRVEGTLVSVVLDEDRLVGLFPDFFSIYSRPKQLEREWSGTASAETLGFEARHLSRLGRDVFAFGATKDGTLRAARLEKDAAKKAWRLVPEESARIDKALEPPPPDAVERAERAAAATPDETPIPPPLAWASAEDTDGSLALLCRVARPRKGEVGPGVVRLVRFDGTTFVASRVTALEHDLVALAALAAPAGAGVSSGSTAAVGTRVLVFGAKRNDPEPKVVVWQLDGTRLVELESIAYKKGGFFEDRPVQALAAATLHGKLLLFAQIGGSVRVAVKENGQWGEWTDVARMPSEALALVYLWGATLALLGVVMVASGAWVLAQRLKGRVQPRELDQETADRLVAEALGRVPEAPAAETPAVPPVEDDEGRDASIVDRLVAFGIDLAIAGGAVALVQRALPEGLVPRTNDDPTRVLAFLAWGLLGLLAYFVASEVVFGRTPGKRLYGLEVRTLSGEPAGRLALFWRNVFRIELIFAATFIHLPPFGDQRLLVWVPFLALVVLLATPRTQRPGDLVAGTVVQRVSFPGSAPEPEPATAEEDGE